jgi:hypothetical protein
VRGDKPVTIRVRVRTTIEQDGDAFHAFAPALRGCHVGGESLEDAQRNLNDGALGSHLHSSCRRVRCCIESLASGVGVGVLG